MTKALYVVGAKEFARTMRKAGADMKELKGVNRKAATIAAVEAARRAPRDSGDLAKSIRAGATQKAGVVRAGRKAVPYAGPINYGWPKRHIRPRFFVNNAAAATEPQWSQLYLEFTKHTLNQVKGQ